MKAVYEATNDITSEEWEQIINALSKSRYASVVRPLLSQNNKPRPAREVLPADIVNQGHAHISMRLTQLGVPFRLTRIGQWSSAERREDRLLAFVRWPP